MSKYAISYAVKVGKPQSHRLSGAFSLRNSRKSHDGTKLLFIKFTKNIRTNNVVSNSFSPVIQGGLNNQNELLDFELLMHIVTHLVITPTPTSTITAVRIGMTPHFSST